MKFRSALLHLTRGSCLALMLGMLAYMPAMAQDAGQSSSKPLFYGPKAGINFSNIYNTSGPTGVARIGYAGGGFGQYRILPWLGASVELQYLQMGSNRHYGLTQLDGGLDAGSNLVAHHINLPVMANLYIPMSGNLEPKVLLGAAFSYNFYSQERSAIYLSGGTGNLIPVVTRTNRTGDFTAFEIAALAGAGVDIPLGNFLLTADVRYRMGFYNVTNLVTDNADVLGDNNVFNAISISVGFGF